MNSHAGIIEVFAGFYPDIVGHSLLNSFTFTVFA
jgi:hypothetical protein